MSPKYRLSLVKSIYFKLNTEYNFTEDIYQYLKCWHNEGDGWNNEPENFSFITNVNDEINFIQTLHTINDETLLKIGIDLGLETPDFIPAIPNFRNAIRAEFATASLTFEKAFKQVESDPSLAVGLANSALECLIKEIIKNENLETKLDTKKTLYDLTQDLLKELHLFPGAKVPKEISQIGNGLLSTNQGIEKLRSEKTFFHGKTESDYLIEDSVYAYFTVNTVTTVGLFLNSYYKNLHPKPIINIEEEDELPF